MINKSFSGEGPYYMSVLPNEWGTFSKFVNTACKTCDEHLITCTGLLAHNGMAIKDTPFAANESCRYYEEV